ncbi:TPA: DDE-type integrase/transposase/recombinase [Morganella morganii]|nr:DDE-type integrase/transposase/recombinase [Morganella morganii]
MPLYPFSLKWNNYNQIIQYAPVLRKIRKKYQFIRAVSSRQPDEIYVKVNGKWFYLYRTIDKHAAYGYAITRLINSALMHNNGK